ncbi:hypothetical protein [Arthrobacter sp. AQ5-05]|nr:hypothetical protein [Arthrobacter sp. AQ5-05]
MSMIPTCRAIGMYCQYFFPSVPAAICAVAPWLGWRWPVKTTAAPAGPYPWWGGAGQQVRRLFFLDYR